MFTVIKTATYDGMDAAVLLNGVVVCSMTYLGQSDAELIELAKQHMAKGGA